MTRVLIEIPGELRWDAAAVKEFSENAPYYLADVRLIAIEGRTVTLEGQSDQVSDNLRRQVESLALTISKNLRDAREQLLFEHLTPPSAQPDPMPALLASDTVIRTGRARFVFRGEMFQVLEGLDRMLLGHAREVAAEPQSYPATVHARTLMQSGYLKAFPQHAFFVAPAARSATSLHEIGACTETSDLDRARGAPLFGSHDQVLAPTVCYHCFEAMQGRELESSRCFTAVNHCHRSEVLAEGALDRLECFRMREVIGFGDEAFVNGLLDACLERTREVLTRWGIAHHGITATDPFFAGAAGSKLFFQSTFALKRELRVRIDFDGRWLSVASFNNHQQSLTRAFQIRGANFPLSSGCVGWGYERIVYALMSQLGTDVSAWPRSVRDDLGV